MNLYDVIAGQGTTHFERLFSQRFGGGEKVHTLTGVPPLSFKGNGKPLISWSMLGNGQQTGTPTPDAPIMPEFVGVRTAQLFDDNNAGYWKWVNSNGSIAENAAYAAFQDYDVGNAAAFVAKYNGVKPYSHSIAFYDSNGDFISRVHRSNPSVSGDAFDVPAGSTKARYQVATNTSETMTSAILQSMKIMLNSGSTALPYEPYGYKIPITCAGQTVPVYLGQVQTVRRVRKLVLTGESNINKNTPSNPNDYLYYLGGVPHEKTDCICSHLRSTDSFPLASVGGVYSKYSAGILYINLSRDVMEAQLSGNTVAGFKEYLAAQYAAGTPVTIWYALETPETGIINEPLCKIGDYADELHSEDAGVTIPTVSGSNTLTVDTELQPSEMTIVYKS